MFGRFGIRGQFASVSRKLRRRHALGRRHYPLGLESLESRVLLTIVFTPFFGAETANSPFPPTEVMSSPTVHLVLWGPNWGTGPGQSNPLRSSPRPTPFSTARRSTASPNTAATA